MLAFTLAARWLSRGRDPIRMAARGLLVGIAAFTAVIFAAPSGQHALFYAGALGIGFGGGLFAVSTLTAAMTLPATASPGAAWRLAPGARRRPPPRASPSCSAAALRDVVGHSACIRHLGAALNLPATGYTFVYHIEIVLLFVTLIVLGPLVRTHLSKPNEAYDAKSTGILEFPT